MNVSEKVKKNKKSFRSILRQEGKMDLTFFFLVIGLLVTGLIMLFSASAPYASNYHSNSYFFITRQLSFAIVGFALMMFFSRVKYKVIAKFAWIIAGISVVMLILVLKDGLTLGLFSFNHLRLQNLRLFCYFLI